MSTDDPTPTPRRRSASPTVPPGTPAPTTDGPRPRGRRVRRAPILLAVVALLVAAVVAQHGAPADSTRSTAAAAVRASTGVPAADVVSSAWYCAAGTSTSDGNADETVVVASLATTTIDVTVTVMPGGNQAPKSVTRRLEPGGQVQIPVSDVLATAEPGVVVETAGGRGRRLARAGARVGSRGRVLHPARGGPLVLRRRDDRRGERARPRALQPLRRRRHRRRLVRHRHRRAGTGRVAGRRRTPPVADHAEGVGLGPAPGARGHPGERAIGPGRRGAGAAARRRDRRELDAHRDRGRAGRDRARQHVARRRRHHRGRRRRGAGTRQLLRPRRQGLGAGRAGRSPPLPGDHRPRALAGRGVGVGDSPPPARLRLRAGGPLAGGRRPPGAGGGRARARRGRRRPRGSRAPWARR